MDLSSVFGFVGELVPVTFLANVVGALEVAQAAMSSYSTYIVSVMGKFVALCFTLYAILYGFALMRGAVQEATQDAYIRVFKIGFVLLFARTFGAYNNEIAQIFWGMPESLIQVLTPSTVMNDVVKKLVPVSAPTSTDISILLIGTVMSFTVYLMNASMEAASFAGQTDPAMFASGLGIGIAGASITAVVAGILLVAKISLSVLLALGPFFIVAILFERTKSYFDGWLSQVLNFILVVVLLTITIYILFPVLIITVASYYAIAKFSGALSLRESVELITLLAIFLAVIKQVPTTAAAVVRGYAVGAVQEHNLVSTSQAASGGTGKSASQAYAEMKQK